MERTRETSIGVRAVLGKRIDLLICNDSLRIWLKRCRCLCFAALMLLPLRPTLLPAAPLWISLEGQWRFDLDPKNEGIQQKWFQSRLKDQIHLPGTTDENHKGSPNSAQETDRLTRLYPYYGAAWYQTDIPVPADWNGKRIVLLLERTKNSKLWVDGNPVGEQDSLAAPHRYALGTLPGGSHQLTLRIHNGEHAPIGDPHQISDQTQTNWNGVIGKVGLEVTDSIWIEDVQVYPDFAEKIVKARIELHNQSGKAATGQITLTGSSSKNAALPKVQIPFSFQAGTEKVDLAVEVNLSQEAAEWSEFSPNLYQLSFALETKANELKWNDFKQVSFGLRDFKARGKQIQINGKTVLLRGKHDACVFPLTGYPPMTVEGWTRVFQIALSYKINHYRFHTWCPPEAAFAAADQLGIYLQPELPNWQAFGDTAHDNFLRLEGERILRAFGNHPSFVMLSLGNELGGQQKLMAPFISHFKSLDSRHLYAQGTNNWFPGPGEGDDYFDSFQFNGKKIRGSFATVDLPLGHVQSGPPSTLKDYTAEIAPLAVPVVSHEIGEYQSAPDFREIPKYTGILAPRNLEVFRRRMAEHGLLEQADDFLKASGALSVLCYREEIEAVLRTRGMSGFQLLDLQDFPGQGTALVGILNAFMESKGFIEPAQWREFCSETVPLIRMPKYTWKTTETFDATAEIANYGPAVLFEARPRWILSDAQGRQIASSSLPEIDIPQGDLTALGDLHIPLKEIAAPAKLRLELALEGTPYRNSYAFWVYPATVDITPGGVMVSRTLDDNTRQALAEGRSVLLLPEMSKLPKSIEGSFASDFWNYGMFKKIAEERKAPVAPGTLGILCNPKDPAFAQFPTDFHSNWQWFHLLMNSRAVILDEAPTGFHPTVQVIDNYERAHKLGMIFEAKVGKGKLMVCAIDLLGQNEKPEAQQLMHSLLQYMNSPRFTPTTMMDEALIQKILQ
jgi:hypothetical protein